MKKQIVLLTLIFTVIPALRASWGDFSTTNTRSHSSSRTIKSQEVKRQLEALLGALQGGMGTKSTSSIISRLTTALENFGHNMPDIMESAQQEGMATALTPLFRQLASATQRLIERHEPNREATCKKMIALIYANHPPAQAHAPEHAPCHKKLALGWHPGAIVGLWEHYVEGTPHAANLITFCSQCMETLRPLLDDAARRKHECTQLRNALWQFESSL